MKVLRLQTFKQPQTVWMQQLIARTDMPSKLTTGHETDSKNKTVCQQWALAITVSFATSCPHSLRVSQLYPLALLILQTAEFHFQEKKKKTAVTFCRAQGRGAEARTWMGGEKKNGTRPNYMIRAGNPRTSAARWQSSQPQRDTDMNVITLCLLSLYLKWKHVSRISRFVWNWIRKIHHFWFF